LSVSLFILRFSTCIFNCTRRTIFSSLRECKKIACYQISLKFKRVHADWCFRLFIKTENVGIKENIQEWMKWLNTIRCILSGLKWCVIHYQVFIIFLCSDIKWELLSQIKIIKILFIINLKYSMKTYKSLCLNYELIKYVNPSEWEQVIND